MSAQSPQGRKRIATYVEAVVHLRALEQAIRDDGPTTTRLVALTNARVAVHHAEAQLNGSLLGAARRALAERDSQRRSA